MNIENLRKLFKESNGELTVKNYPTLCSILGIEPKKGKGKTLQQEDFKRYFNYEKSKQSFIIKEVYQMALEKETLRGAKGKFTDDLQDIMLYVLSQSSKGELLFSKNVLFKNLNMINENYTVARYNVPKLSEFIKVDKDTIYDFYNENNNKMIGYVETALKRLRSRRLIIWEKVMVVAKTIAEINELGETKLNFCNDTDNASVKTYTKYRQATQDEKQIILRIEQDVLSHMGYKNVQQCYVAGMYNKYKNKVNSILQDKLNIKFHFDGYLITYNYDRILEELENIKKSNNEDIIEYRKSAVNKNLLMAFGHNAITRHLNAKDKQKKIDENKTILDLHSIEELKKMGLKGYVMNTRDKVAIKDNFISDTNKIANTVISQLACDVTKELIKEPSKVTTKETENNGLPF